MMAPATETNQAGQIERVRRFRDASRLRGASQRPSQYIADLADSFQRFAGLPWRERQARARACALESLPVYLFPDEHLVGMVYHYGPSRAVEDPTDYHRLGQPLVSARLPENADIVELGLCSDGAAPGHVTWRWDWILEKGVLGLIQDYRRALVTPADDSAAEFYRGVILSLEALLKWNERHIESLRTSLRQAFPEDMLRLKQQISLCERVPAHPARNFQEAVQSFYFQHLAVMREAPNGGNGPGRLDYFLWPYLERDLETGSIDRQQARELIDELFIRLHERIQPADGWVEAVVVGGVHLDGSSAVNPLSHMMVESIIDLDQTHPSIYMRMPPDPPSDWVDLATRYMLEGHNRAQILNDPEILASFDTVDVPRADAAMYTCGGCMEITPQGMNSDLLFTGTVNIAKVLELSITGGRCLQTGRLLTDTALKPLPDHDSFETLYAAFTDALHRLLGLYFQRVDIYSEAMAEHRPLYLMSSMTLDCLERGREQQDGGARYHHYGASPLAIQNTGDSLYAIKRAVYDDAFCAAEEMLAALDADFEGHEALRLRLRALPKFGQGDPGADGMTDRVLNTLCDGYASIRNRHRGRCKPVVLTFVWAPPAGAVLGASADGRLAGTPIAHGLTPQAVGMSEGIGSAVTSHAGLSLERVSGGASSMWDFDPSLAKPEIVDNVLRTFLQLGGQIFQGNTTDVDELLDARKHPDDFPNLLVRVGGYSARFTTLAPALQDEIIGRYRHRS
jgi:trans-4-hydroxy-L-proline dehydratase